MKKYVVTGGAGFIGSTLVRCLLRAGAPKVHVIDNLSSGKRSNLEEVAGQVEFHLADIRRYEEIAGILKGAAVVFHLAAVPSVPKSIESPVDSHETNIDGTFHVLRACADGGAGRVVYAASSSAYGDTPVLPKSESMAPQPKSPYAVQKLAGEYYCSVFTSCWGLETVALRFFNVYGPRQDPQSPYSGVLSIFMKRLMERQRPTIFGDGEQSRDFTYVEDVAELCLKAAAASGVAGKMYNAGNGKRYTLNTVWRMLTELEGVSIEPIYAPERPGDVRHSQADITAAVRDLGHAPRFTLEEGLRRTLAWYKANL
jgi:nucleoside-diphosphate-sugar epimerase